MKTDTGAKKESAETMDINGIYGENFKYVQRSGEYNTPFKGVNKGYQKCAERMYRPIKRAVGIGNGRLS